MVNVVQAVPGLMIEGFKETMRRVVSQLGDKLKKGRQREIESADDRVQASSSDCVPSLLESSARRLPIMIGHRCRFGGAYQRFRYHDFVYAKG